MPGSAVLQSEVTPLATGLAGGDPVALDRLLPHVYRELKRIARRQLRRGGGGHAVSTTELVHETYLKLAGSARLDWKGRAHFTCLAARAMRQVLVDQARRRSAAKRGGGQAPVTLAMGRAGPELRMEDLLALDAALDRLGALNPRLRQVVECRFFAGMTDQEIAAVLALSTRTVERDWAKARMFLYRELNQGETNGPPVGGGTGP